MILVCFPIPTILTKCWMLAVVFMLLSLLDQLKHSNFAIAKPSTGKNSHDFRTVSFVFDQLFFMRS